MPNILSVSQATRAVKDVLEAEFPFIWVRGEVSGVSRPPSGHVYFYLTDGAASLAVVWFKSAQWTPAAGSGDCVHPVTGEVMDECGQVELEDGQEVLCAGRIGVYEPRGVYQLVAELVQHQGAGDLQVAFEAMRRKLADAGYFDESRKKPLPSSPARVALVTSPSGAAIRDFLRLADERGAGAHIRVYPTLVQGAQAPARIAEALARVEAEGWAEVAVLIRGGGSLEDLWAFNTEEVAEAVFRMTVPVVCGVGHEPDVSIADYVADVRAATPSHAAQLLWPRREGLLQRVDELTQRLASAFGGLLQDRREELAALHRGLLWFSPQERLIRLQGDLGRETVRLHKAALRLLQERQGALDLEREALVRAMGPQALERREFRLDGLRERLGRAARAHLDRAGQRLELAGARLAGLDPEAPLERGYSMLRLHGSIVSSISEVHPGDLVDVQVRDGRVHAQVRNTSSHDAGTEDGS